LLLRVAGNNIANFLSKTIVDMINQGNYIILGLIASQDIVGVYYFGFRVAAQPFWMLAGNIGSARLR